ncbi:hypothetical protein HZU72_17605 [Halomonas sp. QX-2]|uniref:Uncharacterized protein n=1 Tax=Vreelandella sedimenti TaxID=2729618 RepID=A0A7Z0N9T4_9GAMM|nr:hypothetical protein [Halomonas sedimenti]NYT74230.1 hypothetical protein [Halomonas sedimenti]
MTDQPVLTEAIVQDVVYAYCAAAKHEITVPNCGSVWGPEADIASVTKARLGHAFEIKVSRADWLAELRQIRGEEQTAKWWRAKTLSNAKQQAAETARMAAAGSNCCGLVPPSYFWMVTAPGLIKREELPEYAGLMEIEPYRFGNVQSHGFMIREVRPAPRLHRVKLLDNQMMAMARGVTLRYWQQRRAVA